MDRKIFNQPVRRGTTFEFHPNRISLEEFKNTIEGSIQPFAKNMERVGGDWTKERFIEEWFQTFMEWSEVEIEK